MFKSLLPRPPEAAVQWFTSPGRRPAVTAQVYRVSMDASQSPAEPPWVLERSVSSREARKLEESAQRAAKAALGTARSTGWVDGNERCEAKA